MNPTSTTTKRIDETHLRHLIAEREKERGVRDAADSKFKALGGRILETMIAAEKDRHQLVDGTIVTVIRQPPRETVSKDKLLKLGVDVDVITAATNISPVAPFPRIDRPKGDAVHEPAADHAADVIDRVQ